jgi:hypothetical protein
MLIQLLKGLLLLLSFLFVVAGCAVTNQITITPRSSTEQKLLVRALERALGSFDARGLNGKTVAVEFYGLTGDKDFAREFFVAWLQSQRVRIAAVPNEAQVRLKVFASVLGVDRGQSFFGSPSFTVPLIGFVVPEVALFRDLRHSGYAEIKISMIDEKTGEFIAESAPAVGKSQHDDYTVLIVVHFTSSDLEEQEWYVGGS